MVVSIKPTDEKEDQGGRVDDGLGDEAGVVASPTPGHQMRVHDCGVSAGIRVELARKIIRLAVVSRILSKLTAGARRRGDRVDRGDAGRARTRGAGLLFYLSIKHAEVEARQG